MYLIKKYRNSFSIKKKKKNNFSKIVSQKEKNFNNWDPSDIRHNTR